MVFFNIEIESFVSIALPSWKRIMCQAYEKCVYIYSGRKVLYLEYLARIFFFRVLGGYSPRKLNFAMYGNSQHFLYANLSCIYFAVYIFTRVRKHNISFQDALNKNPCREEKKRLNIIERYCMEKIKEITKIHNKTKNKKKKLQQLPHVVLLNQHNLLKRC